MHALGNLLLQIASKLSNCFGSRVGSPPEKHMELVSGYHARVLLGIDSSDDQILLAKRAAEMSWSVRRLEEEIGKLKQNGTAKQKRSSSVKLPIGESLGLHVVLKRSNDETRLIIGGLDDSKANKLIDLLKNHLETLFDED